MSMAHDLGHDIPDDFSGDFDLPERPETFRQFCARTNYETSRRPANPFDDIIKQLQEKK